MKKWLYVPLFFFIQAASAQQLVAYEENGKYGMKDGTTGKVVMEAKYDEIYTFSEGLAMVAGQGKYGFVDKAGREVIAPQFAEATAFSEGLAAVSDGESWGYIDKAGKTIIPFNYDDATGFSEGLAAVQLDGLYGYIDKAGKEVIPFQFGFAHPGFGHRGKRRTERRD